LLPASLALEAQRRGAAVRTARPKITRAVGLVHRDSRLSPTAAAFLALADAPATNTEVGLPRAGS
jgi:hypothetical protein